MLDLKERLYREVRTKHDKLTKLEKRGGKNYRFQQKLSIIPK